MTPDEKWKLVSSANRMLRNAVKDRICRHHAGWDPQQIDAETSRELIRART